MNEIYHLEVCLFFRNAWYKFYLLTHVHHADSSFFILYMINELRKEIFHSWRDLNSISIRILSENGFRRKLNIGWFSLDFFFRFFVCFSIIWLPFSLNFWYLYCVELLTKICTHITMQSHSRIAKSDNQLLLSHWN